MTTQAFPNCQIPFSKANHSIRYIIHIIFIIYLPNTIHSLILTYIYIPAFRCTLSYAAHGSITCGGNPWSPVLVPYYITVIFLILTNSQYGVLYLDQFLSDHKQKGNNYLFSSGLKGLNTPFHLHTRCDF